MNNEELVKQIAKNSRKIVDEADAQNLTTEDEVEQIVIDLLSNPETLKEIEHDAKFYAETRMYDQYHSRRYYSYREDVRKLMKPDLNQISDGADYGMLECCVLDGLGEDTCPDVKTAVKKGLVDAWGCGILSDAEDEYSRIHDENGKSF